MKKLPLGHQTFSNLIEEGCIYVDKTKEIHGLLENPGKYIFLSRPRRFGKSLLVSTLSELFSGNRELFKGLWIYDKIEWKKYPVIHIDFSGMLYKSRQDVIKTIDYHIDENIQRYGVTLPVKTTDCFKRFRELIKTLGGKKDVVILVDEYDKPIIDNVGNLELAKEAREILAAFYSVLKSTDEYIKFAFITGVSKFSKVSVFSGLNNLRDISMSPRFGTIVGYTQEELLQYFEPYIHRLAGEMELEPEKIVEKIGEWYSGYSWDGKSFLYNPHSVLSLFTENRFGNYWFSTGTPTFLIDMIKKQKSRIVTFEVFPVSSYDFDSYDINRIDIVPLLFQTGYLTIVDSYLKNEIRHYRLNYPNKEVKHSFLTYIFKEFTQMDFGVGTRMLERINEAVVCDDLVRLIDELKSFFASIPFAIFKGDMESYYQAIIYLIFKLIGAKITIEDPTNTGYIDAVLETEKRIYVMEFKMGKSEDALKQIELKKYYQKYLGSSKEILLVGVGFDSVLRNIDGFSEKTPPVS